MNNIKNLIIQYGTCEENCSYCYLKNLKIKKNTQKFNKTIELLRSYNIENLYISAQNYILYKFYKKIINKFTALNIIYALNHKYYYEYNTKHYVKPIVKFNISLTNTKDLTETLYFLVASYKDYFSCYLDNTNINKVRKIAEKISKFNEKGIFTTKLYLSITKYKPVNFLELFKLYNDYPHILEMDSCYIKMINGGECSDIFVLNEDGNIYTCPYNIDFLDNNLENKPKICPYIKNIGG